MRFLSAILLACIIFLSSFGGLIKPVQPEMADCCKKMAKMVCHEKTTQKKTKDDSCGQPGCAVMLSCSICGFVVGDILTIRPLQGHLIQKPVAHYITGTIATYQPDNWKPPKIC